MIVAMTKTNLGRKGTTSAYTSTEQSIIEGGQNKNSDKAETCGVGQKLIQRAWRNAAYITGGTTHSEVNVPQANRLEAFY